MIASNGNGTPTPPAPDAEARTYAATRLPSHLKGEVALADPLGLFSREGFLPYNPSALVTRRGMAIFDAMRKDDQIKAALLFKKHAVLASGWEVVSPEGKPEDWEVTRFVEHVFRQMRGTLEQKLIEILTAFDYGFSVTEKVFEEIPEGDFKSKIGLRDLKTRRPHDFEFRTDAHGNILPKGILQRQPGLGGGGYGKPLAELPVDKFILFQHQAEFANPYGTSDLEAVYRSYWTKDSAYKWLAMCLERYGIPPVFALYNPEMYSPAQIDALKAILTGMQAATSGVIPRTDKDGLELWSPELAGQVPAVFIPALDMLNRDIARGLLMPGLLGVTPDVLGSFSRAKVIFDVFMLTVQYTRSSVQEEVVQEQIVKPLVDLNYPTDVYPEWRFLPLTDEDTSQLLNNWVSLLRVGAVKAAPEDEAHLRNLLDFPEREREEEGEVNLKELFEYHLGYGLVKTNEARAALGLDPLPEGDEIAMRTELRIQQEMEEQRLKAEAAQAKRDEAEAKAGLNKPTLLPDAGKERPEGKPDGPTQDPPITPDEDAAPDAEAPLRRAMAEAQPAGAEAQPAEVQPAEVQPAEEDVEPEWPFRKPNAVEMATGADYRALAEAMARREDTLVGTLRGALAAAVARLPGLLGDEIEHEEVAGIDLGIAELVRPIVRSGLRGAFEHGRQALSDEARPTDTKALDSQATYVPEDALRFLSSKAEFVAKGLSEPIMAAIRQDLLFALRNGLPVRDAVARITGTLKPWLGDPTAVEPAAASPHRLETIVRTNATDAFNQGRLVQARQPGVRDFVRGMQYSAIIDEATTDICRHLDQRTFTLDDPNLDRFSPPNHFRCRSILVPVTIASDVAPESWADEALVERARELGQDSFVGQTPVVKPPAPEGDA